MTSIEFRTGLPDKLAYLCKLVRIAWSKGQGLIVVVDTTVLSQLDALLWQLNPASFIPHAVLPDLEAQAEDVNAKGILATDLTSAVYAPILLCSKLTPTALASQHQTLIHMGHDVPLGFERFDRLIELVGVDAQDVQEGRQRWKHYKTRGYEPSQIGYSSTP